MLVSTRVIALRKRKLSRGELDLCFESLSSGGLIVFPTDTVYGLACNAFHAHAIQEVYRIKGRSHLKPLPVFLSDVEQLPLVAKEILPEARSLTKAFWPGALTLVFKTAPLALHATRGKSTIAVRIPKIPMITDLLRELPFPLAVTSANTSSRPSLTLGVQARKFFKDKVDVIIDAGGCPIGRESTIVDVTHFPFTVLREGAVPKQNILEAL
jgi:L-threonylcarbamoyladenylate synthase